MYTERWEPGIYNVQKDKTARNEYKKGAEMMVLSPSFRVCLPTHFLPFTS